MQIFLKNVHLQGSELKMASHADDTPVPDLILAISGYWDMSYIFGILRSVWIQNSK